MLICLPSAFQALCCVLINFSRALIKPKSDKSDQKYKEVPKFELVRRLREKGEPVKLFAETHEETCQRLRLVEMMAKEENKGLLKIKILHIYMVRINIISLCCLLFTCTHPPTHTHAYTHTSGDHKDHQ